MYQSRPMLLAALVPILTQSENWALFHLLYIHIVSKWFQSSPSPKTGRYVSKGQSDDH